MVEVRDKEKLTVSCWLCGRPVEVRFTKKDKPYLICSCGVQTFIRYEQAEDLLLAKVKEYQAGS